MDSCKVRKYNQKLLSYIMTIIFRSQILTINEVDIRLYIYGHLIKM